MTRTISRLFICYFALWLALSVVGKFISNSFFISSQISFFASLIILTASFFAYKNRINSRLENARDEILDWLEVSKSIAKSATFATFIDGDSMEPKIEDGSLVLVRQNSILDNGDIGIFYLNEEVFCKKFSQDPFTNIITLKSLNKDYKPITIKENDDFRVIGKVVGAFDYNI